MGLSEAGAGTSAPGGASAPAGSSGGGAAGNSTTFSSGGAGAGAGAPGKETTLPGLRPVGAEEAAEGTVGKGMVSSPTGRLPRPAPNSAMISSRENVSSPLEGPLFSSSSRSFAMCHITRYSSPVPAVGARRRRT